MKTFRLIFVAATISMTAFAADITLTDGRVLNDASINSQTPRKVTIRHAKGLTSVSKEILPAELRALYPVDEAAARIADEKAAIAREAALNARKAESERIALVLAERQASAAILEANQAQETSKKAGETASARANAQRLAERYFEKDYGWVPAGSRSANVTIDEIRPADGADGRWFVTGRAVIKIHSPSARGYSSFQTGGDSDAQWRDQYNAHQISQMNRHAEQTRRAATRDSQNCPDPSRSQDTRSNRSHNRHDSDPPLFVHYDVRHHENNNYTYENRNFEAYYSTESGSPSINITVR